MEGSGDEREMDKVRDGRVVSIAFVLRNAQGDILDKTLPEAPLRYLHGRENIVRGLEARLAGLCVGDHLETVVPPEEGYGLRDGEPQAVPRAAFPAEAMLQPGVGFVARSEDGKPFPLWIVAVDDETVMVDANHPLSGQSLHFSVDVVAVRDATADELQDGRPHSGCQACMP